MLNDILCIMQNKMVVVVVVVVVVVSRKTQLYTKNISGQRTRIEHQFHMGC